MAESDINYSILSDLLDDLNLKQMTDLIHWMWTNKLTASRANIKGWRKRNNLSVTD